MHTTHSTALQTHSTNNIMMVTKREIKYNSKYPNDAGAAVLIANETHWYMLYTIMTMSTALHSKCLPAHWLSPAHPS